jgi:hypothetical protein
MQKLKYLALLLALALPVTSYANEPALRQMTGQIKKEIGDTVEAVSSKDANNKVIIDNGSIQSEEIKISDKQLLDNPQISGKYPIVTGLPEKMQEKVSAFLNKVFDRGLAAVDGNQIVFFSYEYAKSSNLNSLVIHTSISAGNTSSETVNTIVFDSSKIFSLKDLLGKNAVKIANAAINKKINSAPDGEYFKNKERFKGIGKNTQFYVNDEGKVVIVFDKYSIAPGVAGTPRFVIE